MRGGRIVAAAVVIGITALYAVAVQNYFALDDFFWLFIARFTMSTPRGWVQAFVSNTGESYRPLSQNVFFWAGWHAFGFQPLGYHLINLLALAVSAICLYCLFRILVKDSIAPLLATSLFAFSSVAYETVSWAAAFSAASAAAFFIGALLAFAARRTTIATILFVCALLCDETATPLPLIALAMAILVQGAGISAALRRSASLWAVFVIYGFYRWLVTGLTIGRSGPYAVHLDPGSFAHLAWSSIGNAFGWVPPLANIVHGTTPVGQVATALIIAFFAILIVLGVRTVRGHDAMASFRGCLFGLVWFGSALSPLLLFTAGNWSLHNLEVPTMGMAFFVLALTAPESTFWRGAASIAGSLAFFAINAIAIYAPGGWNTLDPSIVHGRAAAPLYRELSWELSNTCTSPLLINIMGADPMSAGAHIAGFNYGISVLTGSSDRAHILFTQEPTTQPVDTVIAWHETAQQFTLVRTNVVKDGGTCSS